MHCLLRVVAGLFYSQTVLHPDCTTPTWVNREHRHKAGRHARAEADGAQEVPLEGLAHLLCACVRVCVCVCVCVRAF
jgi:hypothetical protein